MNLNDYRRVVHCATWFDDKIMLSHVLKKSWHEGFWGTPGGKVENGEGLLEAVCREFHEETGFNFPSSFYQFTDCFFFPERKIKTFLFSVQTDKYLFQYIHNPEPDKQSNWELFTIEEALKLKLMPSVKHYLENLKSLKNP